MTGEADTEPLPILAATAALILGVFLPTEVTPRRPARHAIRRRRDGELLLTGFVLIGLGGVTGLLALLAGAVLPQVAAWAWIVGGLTAWWLSGAWRDPAVRPEISPEADEATIRQESVDASSSIDVRTA